MISGVEDMKFLGEDKEFLIIYSKEKLKSENLDYSFMVIVICL